MAKEYPHSRTADGRGYACGACGVELPDGLLVDGEWTAAGKLRGVTASTPDGAVIHECGTKPKGGGGQHG